MKSTSNNVILHTHLGLGDMFICNGLVHRLVSESNYKTIYIVCKKKYLSTVEKLYKGFSNIQVVPISEGNEYEEVSNLALGANILRVGHEWLKPDLNFDESFYNQLGYNISNKHQWCSVPRNPETEQTCYDAVVTEYPYIFVHDKSSTGEYNLKISSNLPIIRPNDMRFNLLDYLKVIENAKEIHCLNSSFLNMIDLCIKKENMYFHKVKKGQNYPKLTPAWTIINYENN